ncbi:copper resistance CopC family protein [Corynebacterium mayonis]|uniref:copper resistance CopC family protein n=1 Tax=Corynebacterium mayonis TaxID=3062461 RepID=UPI003140555F
MSFVPSLCGPVRWGAAIGVLAVGLNADLAVAHDAVVGADPADGAVVAEFPNSLRLTFSGYPQEGFNTLALSNSDTGEVIFSGQPHLDGRELVLDLPSGIDAQPGNYRIGFQIVSSDGHSTKGMTSFRFAPEKENSEAQPASTQAAVEHDAGTGDTYLPWIVAGAGALLIAAAAIVVAAGRRRANAPFSSDESADADLKA